MDGRAQALPPDSNMAMSHAPSSLKLKVLPAAARFGAVAQRRVRAPAQAPHYPAQSALRASATRKYGGYGQNGCNCRHQREMRFFLPETPSQMRKLASQLRLRHQIRRKKCRCGAQKAKNRPILPLARYLIGRKTHFCQIQT